MLHPLKSKLIWLGLLLLATNAYAAKPDGAKIYQENCSVCHGDQGDGKSRAANSLVPPPKNFLTVDPKELNRSRMIASVISGRPGTAMPAWGKRLSTQEIEAVVDHIRATFMKSKPQAMEGTPVSPKFASTSMSSGDQPVPKADMSLPMPKGLAGDFGKGRTFYMKNCIECHGPKGDGEGPRAYFINPRPRNFLLPLSRQTYNRPALYEAVYNGKKGTVMPAWSKVLSEQQIADVAEFVFRQYIKVPGKKAG